MAQDPVGLVTVGSELQRQSPIDGAAGSEAIGMHGRLEPPEPPLQIDRIEPEARRKPEPREMIQRPSRPPVVRQ